MVKPRKDRVHKLENLDIGHEVKCKGRLAVIVGINAGQAGSVATKYWDYIVEYDSGWERVKKGDIELI